VRYQPKEIEGKWQKRWEEEGVFRCPDEITAPKFYCLEMFPYPSGRIHMGHVRVYTIGDLIARFKRMRGFQVLHPIGWDAFGLPAENAAHRHGTHPASWTWENIGFMREQLRELGISYDWDREFATCSPEYYRWEQLFFLWMLRDGLAYRKRALLNWCDECQTVLANEQVNRDGTCFIHDQVRVTQRELDQWFLGITKYAEELLAGHEELREGWPENVLEMQRNWIGRSEGAEIDFPLENGDGKITVFTTRPDTVYGATFMSMAPEHPLVLEFARKTGRETEVRAFVERVATQDKLVRSSEEAEKEGIFTGGTCRNPLTGASIPIYAANFVLYEYGTGAVMAVPAHDQRDFEFARKYGLPVVVVIQPDGEVLSSDTMSLAYEGEGRMVDSGPFDGLHSEEGKGRITAFFEEKGIGKGKVQFRLRDWGVSRQRYWGCPIPVIHCEACGVVPVPERDLPVVLPEDLPYTREKGNPLASAEDWIRVPCPACGSPARRETDTFDTFFESSWYFLRYIDPKNAPDLRPVLSQGSPGPGACPRERAVPPASFPGDGVHADVGMPEARMALSRGGRRRSEVQAVRGEGHGRPFDEDVEIQAKRSGTHRAHRPVRRGHGEAFLSFCVAPRKGPRLERTGSRGGVSLPRAGVSPDRPAQRGDLPCRGDLG
jgi:leucyl-tRNA synthetase